MREPTEIDIEQRGALGVISLNRPHAHNALTIAMRQTLSEYLPKVARDPMCYAIAMTSQSEKAFCAGGDVRELIALSTADMASARQAFGREYFLNWQHECFSKPTVSLMNGVVMGSGVGITAYGTHRVAGDGYRFAMPETAIGLFPDVGVAYLLARMPDQIGLYLGLTGRRLKRASAYHLGLVTHCIETAEFDAILEEVADVQPVDPVLDTRHRDPGPCDLAPVRHIIRECFSADSVEAIISRLQAVSGQDRAWAQTVIEDLSTKSPLALKVTLKHIRAALNQDLRETLLVDYRLAAHCLASHDFPEGVRAVLIDKDNDASWRPQKLSDVSVDMVNKMFEPVSDDDFDLPTREQMQAARS